MSELIVKHVVQIFITANRTVITIQFVLFGNVIITVQSCIQVWGYLLFTVIYTES